MTRRECLAAFITVSVVSLTWTPRSSATAATQPAESAELERLVDDLGATDVKVREAATAKLGEIGKAAVPALKEGVESDDPEVQARAGELLRLASRRLPPAAPPGSPFARSRSVSVNSRGGVRTTDVNDNGYRIRIKQTPTEIRMDVTGVEAGEERTETYLAPDADTLKRDSPEAYALYEKYNSGEDDLAAALGGRWAFGGNARPLELEEKKHRLDQLRRQHQELLEQLGRLQVDHRGHAERFAGEVRKQQLDRLRVPLREEPGTPSPQTHPAE